jgi:hypothetical protein
VSKTALPTVIALRAERKDNTMSEQDKPTGYMQELDRWTGEQVIWPLMQGYQDRETSKSDEPLDLAVQAVKKAIRERVLESYHNGKAAQAPRAFKRPGYAKR